MAATVNGGPLLRRGQLVVELPWLGRGGRGDGGRVIHDTERTGSVAVFLVEHVVS